MFAEWEKDENTKRKWNLLSRTSRRKGFDFDSFKVFVTYLRWRNLRLITYFYATRLISSWLPITWHNFKNYLLPLSFRYALVNRMESNAYEIVGDCFGISRCHVVSRLQDYLLHSGNNAVRLWNVWNEFVTLWRRPKGDVGSLYLLSAPNITPNCHFVNPALRMYFSCILVRCHFSERVQ